MSITIKTFTSTADVELFQRDLMALRGKVLNVNMNQFAYSNANAVHSDGYATCIGVLVASATKGCLAHIDMNVPAFAGIMNAGRWPEENFIVYQRSINRMLKVVGEPADLVLWASQYSRSDKDKSVDLLEPLAEWALELHGSGAVTGVWDLRTHPDRPRTDKLGKVASKGIPEHFGRALYLPARQALYLFQSAGGGNSEEANTWAWLNAQLQEAIAPLALEALSAADSSSFASQSKNYRAMQVGPGDKKMVAAD
jgi:hypothetical protein